MPSWAMVIDLDKCVACQACSIACRHENNTPVVPPEEAAAGRAIRWNDVLRLPVAGEGPVSGAVTGNGLRVAADAEDGRPRGGRTVVEQSRPRYIPRPCMHCANPPCVKVCPVQATYVDDEGLVRMNYDRCIGCRFCTVACPYAARYFNWEAPWQGEPAPSLNPDAVTEEGSLEGPAVRPRGVVEKCTFCIHRLRKARARAAAAGRAFRADEYVPACVETCTAKARYFGDLSDPDSTVSQLAASSRAFALQEEAGTRPKVIYLREG